MKNMLTVQNISSLLGIVRDNRSVKENDLILCLGVRQSNRNLYFDLSRIWMRLSNTAVQAKEIF